MIKLDKLWNIFCIFLIFFIAPTLYLFGMSAVLIFIVIAILMIITFIIKEFYMESYVVLTAEDLINSSDIGYIREQARFGNDGSARILRRHWKY